MTDERNPDDSQQPGDDERLLTELVRLLPDGDRVPAALAVYLAAVATPREADDEQASG